jgi:hypothetical protein
MIRVRINNGWGFFHGAVGEVVDRDADGWVLVLIDGDTKPLRFDDTDVEPLDDTDASASPHPHA